jgi:YegS/Rv2252/BmrU family lipid kinase
VRALIVVNPAARGARAGVQPAVDLLAGYGWQVEVAATSHVGHATRLTRRARSRCDVVVAAGGDGTVNEVVNGLAGTEVALGVLPLGTVNVWAREVGVRGHPLAAAKVLLTGERHRVDLGQAGGRYFLLMAGVGFDAAVVAAMDPTAKRRFGALPYVTRGAWAALRERPWPVRLRTPEGDFETEATWILVGNTRLYGGLARICGAARARDGLLDVVIFGRGGALARLGWSIAALRGRHTNLSQVSYRHLAAFSLETEAPQPVHVDAEVAGHTPLAFRCVPEALQVIVPRGAAPELFAAPAVEREPR